MPAISITITHANIMAFAFLLYFMPYSFPLELLPHLRKHLHGLRQRAHADKLYTAWGLEGGVAWDYQPLVAKAGAFGGYAGAHVSLENVGLDIDTVKIRL